MDIVKGFSWVVRKALGQGEVVQRLRYIPQCQRRDHRERFRFSVPNNQSTRYTTGRNRPRKGIANGVYSSIKCPAGAPKFDNSVCPTPPCEDCLDPCVRGRRCSTSVWDAYGFRQGVGSNDCVSICKLETPVAESCTASRPSKSPLLAVAILPHVHDRKNRELISDSFILLIRGLATQGRSECLVVFSKATDLAQLLFPCLEKTLSTLRVPGLLALQEAIYEKRRRTCQLPAPEK
jgi:hypothetical protein